MRGDTKLEQIRSAMMADDWDTALRIAGTFVRLGEQKEAIQLASESLTNSKFYEQLGYDLEKIKNDGIKALKERFSNSWKEVKQKRKENGDLF